MKISWLGADSRPLFSVAVGLLLVNLSSGLLYMENREELPSRRYRAEDISVSILRQCRHNSDLGFDLAVNNPLDEKVCLDSYRVDLVGHGPGSVPVTPLIFALEGELPPGESVNLKGLVLLPGRVERMIVLDKSNPSRPYLARVTFFGRTGSGEELESSSYLAIELACQ